MAATIISTELVQIEEPLTFTERGAIAGFLAGYTGNTLVSSLLHDRPPVVCRVVQQTKRSFSMYDGRISKFSVELWKPTAACDRPWPDDSQRWVASTGTATSKGFLNGTRCECSTTKS